MDEALLMSTGDAVRKLRVLVAEDDSALRRLLELRLSVDGYEVRTVCDGAGALEMVQIWAPDIFVCDVMMPRVSGLSVCRELRASEAYAALPIVLLTARVFDEDIEAVMALGGMTFMNKPFNADQLNRTMRQMLGDRVPNPKATLSWLSPSPPEPDEIAVAAARRQRRQL